MDMPQWESVIKVNLTSAFCVTNAVIKYMSKARQGSIINMSSIVGRHGNVGQANYSASSIVGIIGDKKESKDSFTIPFDNEKT